MIKELEKIRKSIAGIKGAIPDERTKLLEQLKTAQADLTKAAAAKENAKDLAEFDAAVEAVKSAEMRFEFLNKKINNLTAAPKMDEADYNKAVAECQQIMRDSASRYRIQASELMDELKRIKDEYLDEAREINETLIALDKAANVLQSKYPSRDLFGRWENHAIRFTPADAARIATDCDAEDKISNPHYQHDSILSEAWRAVDRAYPHRSF